MMSAECESGLHIGKTPSAECESGSHIGAA